MYANAEHILTQTVDKNDALYNKRMTTSIVL